MVISTEELETLMKAYDADLVKMRKDIQSQGIKVAIGTISRWINKNSELKKLAEKLRGERAKKSVYHGGDRSWRRF